MQTMSTFKIIVLVFFGILLFVAVVVFSTQKSRNTNRNDGLSGSVTIWGAIDDSIMSELLNTAHIQYPDIKIKYTKKSPRVFDEELLQAMATGTAPDLIIIDDTQIAEYANKVAIIPYSRIPVATFDRSLIRHGDLVKVPTGYVALPLTVDPLVMYYNQNILDSSFILQPPTTWDDVTRIAPSLVRTSDEGLIEQGAISLGTFRNIPNATSILSLLLLQGGNSIISLKDGRATPTLAPDLSEPDPSIADAIRFYISFSDPRRENYSWDTTLGEPRQLFLSDELALYIGFASEAPELRKQNPNLPFGIAPVPQIAGAKIEMTFGRMTSIALTRQSQNPLSALTIAELFASAPYSKALANGLGTVSAHRFNLAPVPEDSALTELFKAAIISRGWLDPSPVDSRRILSELVENISAGTLDATNSIKRAHSEFQGLLR